MHRRFFTAAFLALASSLCALGDEAESLAPFTVTATRTTENAAQLTLSRRLFRPEELAASATLDDALRADPAFSLFRRSSSLAAHPTAQGVSLRGIGPSGASRSLVLLDGVPVNDPFGGWVAWAALPRLSLQRAEILHGGGSGAWGNAALGGTISLASTALTSSRGAAQLEAGQFETRSLEASQTVARQNLAAQVDARFSETEGYFSLRSEDRGPVDEPAGNKHAFVQLRARGAIAGTEAVTTLRYFNEERTNGTRLQRNATEHAFASLAFGARRADTAWSVIAYGQSQEFSSFFSSVSADRASETPANDQFAVPATALGASATFEFKAFPTSRTTTGIDFRHTRGETREEYLFNGDRFTRRRFAGGTQQLGGVFATHTHELAKTLQASANVRLDRWENLDGHRREQNLTNGQLVLEQRFAERAGEVVSGGAGLRWSPHDAWAVRLAGYRAFRLPTLNELYRPFRVGNTNTEANPELSTEKLEGAEIGVDYTDRTVTATVTGFLNELRDAVGNVTLSQTPALTNRQRQNIERTRVQGVEATLSWTPRRELKLSTAYQLSDARVKAASAQPTLVGRRLAQVPRHTITGGLELAFPAGFKASVRIRYVDTQFEDDENELLLDSAITTDLRLAYALRKSSELYVALDNAFDAAVPVGRSFGSITSYGTPRFFRGGLRAAW